MEELENRLVLSPPGAGWQLLWADEFNGTSLDTSIWGVANGPRRHAVNTANAVDVGGGNLTITTYTSGGTHYTGFIGSYNGFLATYGYYEARIKYQSSDGMWSAFWLQSPTMGNPIGNPGAAGTEIDISEHRSRDAGGANMTNKSAINIHWDGYGADHKSVGTTVNNPGSPSLQNNFHVYGLEWSPSGYKFYIDGTQVWSTTQAISRRSEFIYLTSEVQNGSWAGPIPAGGYGTKDASQTKMIVDWVRVWQKPISDLPDQVTREDTATGTISYTVTARDGLPNTHTATSDNQFLVPDSNIVKVLGGANRGLNITPATDQTGVATITVGVSNPVMSGTDTFKLTVNAGSFNNGGFELDPFGVGWNSWGTAQVVNFNQRSGSRAMRMNGAAGGSEQVVTGLSPNTTYTLGGWARVSHPSAQARIGVKGYGGAEVWTSTSNTGYAYLSLTFTTGPTSTQATVYVVKPTGSNAADFDDLILFRAPTITAIADQSTNKDTPTALIPFSVGKVSSAAGAWSATVTSSNQTLVPDANIVLGGSGLNRNLQITPAADQSGSAIITVTVTDLHGGSSSRSFTLTVNSNVPPVLAPIADQAIPASQLSLAVPLSATDPDGGPLTFSAVAQSLAYVLNQQYQFFTDGNFSQDWGGLNERWLQGAGGLWYFVLPDGQLYLWGGGSGATGTLVGNVGSSYWDDPYRLVDAPAGQPRATLSISGNSLTITRDPDWASALVVTVTVSDGLLTDSKTFTVTVGS